MPPQFDVLIYAASIWVIPLIIAITFHEAAHGYVAHFFGDTTAWQLGRVTLNPFKHIDPVGTILLPALLFVTRSSFSSDMPSQYQSTFGRFATPVAT
jgi:Zn-dependent protease